MNKILYLSHLQQTVNRTNVELKQPTPTTTDNKLNAVNRTNVELKPRGAGLSAFAYYSVNRTNVELKPREWH